MPEPAASSEEARRRLVQLLEPDLVATLPLDTDISSHQLERLGEISSAISLRRIADALFNMGSLPGNIVEALLTPLNQYGEGIGECISGQLERSQR